MQMIYQAQQEQAAAEEARARETERQGRLSTGVNTINRMFNPEQYGGDAMSGFNDAYYDRYRQSQLDYYMPELTKQYDKAKENLTYDHARAGTLNSSMSSQNLADLAYQNDLNKANIISTADNATAQQRANVNSQKQALINQLYSTENPDVASNLALNSVRTIQNQTPQFSTIGELFKNAVVGATNAYSAYSDPYAKMGKPTNLGSPGRNV